MPQPSISSVRLLAAVLTSGRAARFVPMDFAQIAKPTSLANAVDDLIERGLVERVVVRCGEWFYRVADVELAAKVVAGVAEMPKPPPECSGSGVGVAAERVVVWRSSGRSRPTDGRVSPYGGGNGGDDK